MSYTYTLYSHGLTQEQSATLCTDTQLRADKVERGGIYCFALLCMSLVDKPDTHISIFAGNPFRQSRVSIQFACASSAHLLTHSLTRGDDTFFHFTVHVLAAYDVKLWISKRIINENPLKSTQPTHRRIEYYKQLHQINQTRGTWVNCLANLVPKCDTIIDLFNFNSHSLLSFLDAMERISFDSAEWVICGGFPAHAHSSLNTLCGFETFLCANNVSFCFVACWFIIFKDTLRMICQERTC